MNSWSIPHRKFFLLTHDRDLALHVEAICHASGIVPCSIQAVAELPEFVQHCRQNFGCLGLVDLTGLQGNHFVQFEAIHGFAMRDYEVCLLAIVDPQEFQLKSLLQVGFRGVICPSRLSRLGEWAYRYWESVAWPQQNITELMISNLPWPAIE